ncbi:MAG: hypothetical protein VCB79_12940 [Dehalococcoidia bacterium]
MTTILVREMEQAAEEAEAVVAEAAIESSLVEAGPVCAHYWVIAPANGPVSQGTCQNFLEVRDFKNFVDSYHQDDE